LNLNPLTLLDQHRVQVPAMLPSGKTIIGTVTDPPAHVLISGASSFAHVIGGVLLGVVARKTGIVVTWSQVAAVIAVGTGLIGTLHGLWQAVRDSVASPRPHG
jgi:hypothetical protein